MEALGCFVLETKNQPNKTKTLNIMIISLFFFLIRNYMLCTSSSIYSPVVAVLYCFSNVFGGLARLLCITLPCRHLCKGCGWLNVAIPNKRVSILET